MLLETSAAAYESVSVQVEKFGLMADGGACRAGFSGCFLQQYLRFMGQMSVLLLL